MMTLYQRLHAVRYTVTVGLVLGLILSPATPALWGWLMKHYDFSYPVVSMKGELVSKRPGEVIISIYGTKHRDCNYMGVQAFTVSPGGHLHDAYKQRIDMPEQVQSRPVGSYDIGEWKIWPVHEGATAVVVFVQHECSGRLVTTKIAEVALK